tara:strand:- start:300 stop:473 length:174 start_codon:yes stop_codon:yes gene_type:complete
MFSSIVELGLFQEGEQAIRNVVVIEVMIIDLLYKTVFKWEGFLRIKALVYRDFYFIQ